MRRILLLVMLCSMGCVDDTVPASLSPGMPFDLPSAKEFSITNPTGKPLVVLGFDTERAMEESLPFVLGALEERNISATFFCNGDFLALNPGIGEDILERHELASHSGIHVQHALLPYIDQYRTILFQKEFVQKTYGVEVKGFRAPFRSMDEDTLEALSALGFTYDSDYYCKGKEPVIAGITPHPTSCLDASAWFAGGDGYLIEDDSLFSQKGLDEIAAADIFRKAFDLHARDDKVMIVALHPSMIAEKRTFFLEMLDYAQQHGAQFMTHAELQTFLEQDMSLVDIQ